jgi:hypothetical protein
VLPTVRQEEGSGRGSEVAAAEAGRGGGGGDKGEEEQIVIGKGPRLYEEGGCYRGVV